MDYVFHLIVLVAIYGILAMSLDLVAGQTGIISLCHAAFFGIGAYSSALLSVKLGAPLWLGVLVGALLASSASLLVSLPSVRLRDDYLVIATFGFQVIFVSLANNWMALTNGPLGVYGIPKPRILGITLGDPSRILPLALMAVAVVFWLLFRLVRAPFGLALRAVREDEIFAQSLGHDVGGLKLRAFAVSAAVAAGAGSLYAHYATYVDPEVFQLDESILILSMVIVGGAASKWGPLLGAALLLILPESLRFVGIPGPLAANLREILYGSLLVAVLIFRPQGLATRYRLEAR